MNIINKFDGKTIEFHVLQPLTMNCLNRDNNNEPKYVDIPGGGRRQRISSQCWKYAIRKEFISNIGYKCVSDKLIEIVKNKAIEKGCEEKLAEKIAITFNTEFTDKSGKLKNDKNNVVKHISINEVDAFIDEYAKDWKNALKNVKFNKVMNSVEKEIDIAMFGRMVAADPDKTIEAAASFAHVYSINEVDSYTDWYTANLDYSRIKDGTSHKGAGHLGDTSMMPNSIIYRYFNVSLGTLYTNVNGNINTMKEYVKDFINASFNAYPHAHQSGMTSAIRPAYIRIDVIDTCPHQIDFNVPINENIVPNAIKRINECISADIEFDGCGPIKTFEMCRENSIEIENKSNKNDIISEIISYIDSIGV